MNICTFQSSQHSDLAFAGAVNLISSQPQQLPSPGSKVADKQFLRAPPAALAQKQAQQQPLPHQSQNPTTAPAVAVAAAPVPLLELSLSSHQIALLQAAADNAQRYMDKDVANAGENTKHLLDAISGESFTLHELTLCLCFCGFCVPQAGSHRETATGALM